MMQKVTVVVAITSLAMLVKADDRLKIPEDCLKKGGYFGDNSVADIAAFDQTNDLLASLPVHYTPYKYSLCVDLQNNNKLMSFDITFADAAGENTFTLPTVGNDNLGTCTTIDAASRTFARNAIVH